MCIRDRALTGDANESANARAARGNHCGAGLRRGSSGRRRSSGPRPYPPYGSRRRASRLRGGEASMRANGGSYLRERWSPVAGFFGCLLYTSIHHTFAAGDVRERRPRRQIGYADPRIGFGLYLGADRPRRLFRPQDWQGDPLGARRRRRRRVGSGGRRRSRGRVMGCLLYTSRCV